MHNDSLLYKVLAAAILLLLIVSAALPAVMQDNAAPPAAIANDAFTVTGMLESISMQEIVVDGLAVDIRLADLNTRLTLGDTVRVEGNVNEGVFTARWIGPPAVQNPATSSNESSGSRDTFDFRGVIDSVGDGFVIVSGQQINTANLNPLVPLMVGQVVRVRGVIENGVFNPRVIQSPNSSGFFDDDLDDRFDDDQRDLNIPADCVVTAPAGWVSYAIRAGDSLSSIAARSGSSVAELVRVNCLSNPRYIVAGANLLLPRVPTSFPGFNRNNSESSNSRSFNDSSSSNSGGRNESSGSNSRNSSSRSSRSNESSGSNSSSSSGSS